MDFHEACEAIKDAENTLQRADFLAKRLAVLMVGRLRKVSPWILCELKRELRSFNMHTLKWDK